MPEHPPSCARAALWPSRLPSISRGQEWQGRLPGRSSLCSVADYSHFPARAPSPLSASCLRLLPGFTRAISKRSLEIDFYHLVINIVYGDITAPSSRAGEGGEAGGRPRPTPAPRGTGWAPPRPCPHSRRFGQRHPTPSVHPSIQAAGTEGAASLAPRAIKHLKSHRNKPRH